MTLDDLMEVNVQLYEDDCEKSSTNSYGLIDFFTYFMQFVDIKH